MIKKTIILGLVLLVGFTLVGCSQKTDKSTNNNSSGSVSCSITPSVDKPCTGEDSATK